MKWQPRLATEFRQSRAGGATGDDASYEHAMNHGVAKASDVAPPHRDLQHACPRCRTVIALDQKATAVCPCCGFQALFERGVYRFVAGVGAEQYWQDTYDALATNPEGDPTGYSSAAAMRHRVAAFRHLCGATAGARILDVGCADGAFWEALFERRPAVGVDFSFEMCVLARRRGMLAHQADALALPFANDEFDLVYGAGLLEHIDDLQRVFAEVARVCRPGGSIVMGTANRLSLARQGMRLVRRLKPRRDAIMRRSIIMRSVGDLIAAAQAASLTLDRACWAYFPLPWQQCSASPRNLLSPLATTVVAQFTKRLPV